MPLRIHFTTDDLARVTLLSHADPLWELVLSLTLLQSTCLPPGFREWRSTATTALSAPVVRRAARLLTTLVPPTGDFPDFLTPAHATDLAEGVAAVRATPARVLRADLPAAFGDRRPPVWVRELAGGQARRLAAVADAVGVYGEAVLAPRQHEVDAAVQADQALRTRDLTCGGVGRLLARLPPPMSWSPPVLTTRYPVDRDLYLHGRGLTLVPSYFCRGAPVTLIDPELPPVLVYAVAPDSVRAPEPPPAGLAGLLGRTRAEALRALCVPHSTSELARRIGTSVGTASKHASVLRESGLVTSTRHANTVVHVATRLGRSLVERGARQDAAR